MSRNDPPDTPTWNTSTTVLRTLRHTMRGQGWHEAVTMPLPCVGATEPLPRRPLDLGVGWWR